MCLSTVKETYSKPSNLIVDGWKEFSGPDKALKFMNFGGAVKMDEWIKSGDIKVPQDIAASDGKMYRAGFHVYADELEVRTKLHYRRVYIRKITSSGDQDGKACVIAQEMYVPSDQDAWPSMPFAPAPPPPAAPAPKKKRWGRR